MLAGDSKSHCPPNAGSLARRIAVERGAHEHFAGRFSRSCHWRRDRETVNCGAVSVQICGNPPHSVSSQPDIDVPDASLNHPVNRADRFRKGSLWAVRKTTSIWLGTPFGPHRASEHVQRRRSRRKSLKHWGSGVGAEGLEPPTPCM